MKTIKSKLFEIVLTIAILLLVAIVAIAASVGSSFAGGGI